MSIINPEIGNNLIATSVLSPAFNFADYAKVENTTQGEINKTTLLNRVKKLDQSQRQELVDALNEFITQINSPVILNDEIVPLSEKGVCTLILADDGSEPKTSGIFTAFLNVLMNLFRLRISSASIVDKITETRDLLVDQKKYLPLQGNIDPVTLLNREIKILEQQLQEPSRAPQIQLLIDQVSGVNGLQNQLEQIKDANWYEPITFIPFLKSLAQLNTSVNMKIICDSEVIINNATGLISDIIVKRKQNNALPAFAAMLLKNKNVIPNFQKSETPIKTWESWQNDLRVLASGESLSVKDKNDIKYWEKQILLPFIDDQLKLINKELTGIISSFDIDKQRKQTDLEVLKGRLETYNVNISKNIHKLKLDAVGAKAKRAEKQLNDINSICKLFDLLIITNDQKPEEIALTVNLACDQLRWSDAELRSTGDIEQLFDILKCILSIENLSEKTLVEAVIKHSDENKIDFKNLEIFVGNLVKLLKECDSGRPIENIIIDIDPDERAKVRKKLFIDKIIGSSKSNFEILKSHKEAELAHYHQKMVKLEEVIHPRPAQKPPVVQQPRPQPIILPQNQPAQAQPRPQQPIPVTLPISTSVRSNVLPPELEIPATGSSLLRNHLITTAKSIQSNRKDPTQDHTWYKLVNIAPHSLFDHGVVQQIYKNFYCIVKDAGQLTGHLHTEGPNKGHSTDTNWGGRVFVEGDDSIHRPLLNHYRVQAIVDYLNGNNR